MLFEKLYTFTGHIKMNNTNGYEFYGNDHLSRIKDLKPEPGASIHLNYKILF